MLNPGEMIAHKLRVTRQIGSGGMGVVYEAVQVHLGRRVAVKVIHPSESQSQEARARFVREAQAQAQLPLDHIVHVLDVDSLPSGDLYMVMEHLDGRDLKRELAKRGPLPVSEAVSYIAQACEGIAAAHDAGIVHRDLKPQNLFVTNLEGKRRVKILDFGVAKMAQSAGLALTSSSAAVGTPLYMSPEQLGGTGSIDGRSDLWALGVVLFELLTGKTPFKRETMASTLAAVLLDDSPPLGEERDDVPLGLEQVVLCCLAKAPDARFEDARELAAALAPYATFGGMVSVSKQAPRGSSAVPPPDDRPSDSLVMPPPAPRVPLIDESDDLPDTARIPVSVVAMPPERSAPAADRDAATMISIGPDRPRPRPRALPRGRMLLVAGVAAGMLVASAAALAVAWLWDRPDQAATVSVASASAPKATSTPDQSAVLPLRSAPAAASSSPIATASASASPPEPRITPRRIASPAPAKVPTPEPSGAPVPKPEAGDSVPLHL